MCMSIIQVDTVLEMERENRIDLLYYISYIIKVAAHTRRAISGNALERSAIMSERVTTRYEITSA